MKIKDIAYLTLNDSRRNNRSLYYKDKIFSYSSVEARFVRDHADYYWWTSLMKDEFDDFIFSSRRIGTWIQ